MADGVTLSAGSLDGAKVATDEDTVGSTGHHQYVKVEFGADNTFTKVTSSVGLPTDMTDDATRDLGIATVDNGGTFVVQEDGAALTALQLIDDAVHADDAGFTLGTSKGVAIMGFAGTQSVDANDAAVLACDTDGALHIADGGNVISVDDGAGSLTVDNNGTFSVQLTGNGLTALQLIDNASVNHDAASVAGVTQIGLAARSTAGTAVGDGDAVRALATLLGKQVTIPYAIPAQTWSYAAASGGITDTTGVTAKAAAGAGIRNYVTSAQIVNAHDTIGTDVQIRDGAAGTVLWRGWAEQTGGGVSVKFDPPLRGTANTLIEVACGTTGTATYFNLQGYVAAE